jgi:hypothetical protein
VGGSSHIRLDQFYHARIIPCAKSRYYYFRCMHVCLLVCLRTCTSVLFLLLALRFTAMAAPPTTIA